MRRLVKEVECEEALTNITCKNVGEYDDFKAVYIDNNLVSVFQEIAFMIEVISCLCLPQCITS